MNNQLVAQYKAPVMENWTGKLTRVSTVRCVLDEEILY